MRTSITPHDRVNAWLADYFTPWPGSARNSTGSNCSSPDLSGSRPNCSPFGATCSFAHPPAPMAFSRADLLAVIALVILLVGFLFTLIGRILLIGAAFSVSAGWGIGVLLPFGPLFFRLNYPELAPLSRVPSVSRAWSAFLVSL